MAHLEPETYQEAMGSPQAALWRQAMDEEMTSLAANNTWEPSELPKGTKPIPLKWVFKIKKDSCGNIQRYKARVVAKSCRQRKGIDYNEVFAPVSKHATLCTLLAIIAALDLELHQLDIKTAFLNGELEEEIYVLAPPGYESSNRQGVYRLRKALYGLKQAPRAWHARLQTELDAAGFVVSKADAALYILTADGQQIYLLTYVDDLLIAGKDINLITELKNKLKSAFALTDMGPAEHFLGMKIVRDRDARTLTLTQAVLTSELLEKFRMDEAKTAITPLVTGMVLTRNDGEPLDTQAYPYSELVGSLLYLSICTRPDIAQAVGVLSRYMSAPTMDAWRATMHVLRYLAGTM